MCDSVGLEKSCDSSALHISFTMVNFFIKQTIELIQQKKKKNKSDAFNDGNVGLLLIFVCPLILKAFG